MAPEEVTAAVATAGLRPLPVIDVPPYHYAATFERLPHSCPGRAVSGQPPDRDKSGNSLDQTNRDAMCENLGYR